MRSIGVFGLALVSVVAMPGSATAQRCVGLASFADGNLRTGVGVSTTGSGWHYVDAEMVLGREHGVFVGGGVSRGTASNSDVVDNVLGASIGYQVRAGSRLHVCPKLDVSHSSATWYYGRTRADYGNTATAVSAAIGVSTWSSKRFDFVPSVEFAYALVSARVRATTYGTKDEGSATFRTGGAILTPGLIFHKSVTLNPFVTIPLGVKGAKSAYGAGLGFNFGPKR